MNIIKKMRLTLVLHAPLGGGAERFMLNLTKYLNKHFFKITLILFNTKGEYAHMIPNDIAVLDLGMPLKDHLSFIHPKWIWRLAVLLYQTKPHLIFSTLGMTNLMVILAKTFSSCKCPLIIRETRIVSNHIKLDDHPIFRKLVYRLCYPKADAIVAPSEAIINDLRINLGIKLNRVQVIPNALDNDYIDKEVEAPITLPGGSTKKNRPVIITVGRLEYVKGMDVALRVFHKLQKRIPCELWILGQGKQLSQLKKFVTTNKLTKKIFFLGFKKNPYAYFKQADIFLLTSRSEGFPNVLLEAMYCGLPCVTTRFNATIDNLITSTINALIIDQNNETGLVDALETLLTNPGIKETLAQNSLIKAQTFLLKGMASQYEELFLKFSQI